MFALKKTLVVEKRWIEGRATGKRHGPIVGKGFKLNPPKVISAHIQEQIKQAARTPEDNWRWWQLSDKLVVEKSLTDIDFDSSFTTYYFPQRHWRIVQNRSLYFGEEVDWYAEVADIVYEPNYGCWLFADLFTDVVIKEDKRTYDVLDLDDLAEVFEAGLIRQRQLVRILRDTQALVDLIRSGDFPPEEVKEFQRFWVESVGTDQSGL